MADSFDLRLYQVTDSHLSLGRPLEQIIEEAVRGGVTLVQLREKELDTKSFYEQAVALKKLLRHHNIPLIINDRLDIALASQADGLHIGQNDLPYPVARQLLGKDKIIGLSVEHIDDALQANAYDVDYIGISPVFSTPTKTDTAAALGLGGIADITRVSRHPAVAIGGINLHNAAPVLRAGADGLSVVSAIMSAPDPCRAAAAFRQLIDQTQTSKKQKEDEAL